MAPFIGWLLLALGMALGPAAGQASPEGLRVEGAWSRDAVWDDGQAEVAHYDSRRRVYAVERAFETVIITVKEDFDRGRAVKADPPYAGRDLVTVLKMNVLSRIQTENYPYNYMTSVFVKREDPGVLVKLAGSSQEWCGTTFKEVVTWDGMPYLLFHSYFDGQGDGRHPLALGRESLLEDQLLLALRGARLQQGLPYRFNLYDSLITNSVRPPAAHAVSATFVGAEDVTVPAGSFRAERIEVKPEAGRLRDRPSLVYWIEQGGMRALVKWEASDGRSLALKAIARRNYWSG